MINQRVEIKINCSNDAFYPDQLTEVSRILRGLTNVIDSGSDLPFNLRDSNGNTVGSIEFIDI